MAKRKSQKEFDKDQAKAGVEPLQSPNKDYAISVTINMPYPVNDKYEEQGALEKMEDEMEEKKQARNGIMAVTTTGSVPLPINKKPAKRKGKKDEKLPREKFWSKAEERRYQMYMKKLGK